MMTRTVFLLVLTVVATNLWPSLGTAQNANPFDEEQTSRTTPSSPAIPKPSNEPNLRGPEGIEFQPIALDTSVACSATLMKGSRRFQNTVFVFPRVLISSNPRGERLFEITRLADDRYLVRFSVFFPRTDQDLKIDDPEASVSLRRCNLDEVKRAITSSSGANVQTVSRVPISTIEVSVDGLERPFTLGGGQASMFNYQDSGHVVEFEVSDRARLESLLARVQSEIGLGIHVAMRFNARTADGGATINIDLKNLAAQLGASLSGKKWIAKGDLSAAMERALKQMRVTVDTESNSSEQTGADGLHDSIVTQLMSLIMSAAYTDAGLMPVTEDCLRYGECGPAGRSGGTADPGPIDPVEPPQETIRVSALIDYLNKKASYRFEYNNVGASETFIYRTSVYFKGQIGDPDLRRYQIASGERRVTAYRLEKDVLISVAVPEITKTKLTYPVRTHYFSSSQLREYSLHKYFGRLRDERIQIQDRAGRDGLAARMMASARPWETNYYVWGQAEASETIAGAITEEPESTLAAITSVPLEVSFDVLGSRKFKLSDLAKESVYWYGSFDEFGGRILLKPKKTLGQMTVRNKAAEKMAVVPVRWLFEEYRNPNRGVLSTQTRNEVRQRLPQTKTTVFFMLGMPGEDSGTVDVVPSESGSQLDGRGKFFPIKATRR